MGNRGNRVYSDPGFPWKLIILRDRNIQYKQMAMRDIKLTVLAKLKSEECHKDELLTRNVVYFEVHSMDTP